MPRIRTLIATAIVAGATLAVPAGAMAKLKAAEGFRFLPIPFSKPLQEDYLPAALSKTDYPGMVSSDEGVETVALSGDPDRARADLEELAAGLVG